MAANPNLQYMLARTSAVTTQTFKLNPQNSTSASANSIIRISLPSNTGWFALSNDYSYGLVWRSTPDGRNELVCQWHASGEDPFCNTGIEVTVILVILIVLALVGYSLSADPA